MVGFDDGSEDVRLLNESKDDEANVALLKARVVTSINANLTGETDITQARPLAENAGICFQGPVKVGPFELQDLVAQQMFSWSNPHGASNTEVIKPWLNASDITGRSRKMWIIDFGDLKMEDAALYEAPFEYVKRNVKPLRDENNDRQRKVFWWRLGRSGSDFKKAKAGKN